MTHQEYQTSGSKRLKVTLEYLLEEQTFLEMQLSNLF